MRALRLLHVLACLILVLAPVVPGGAEEASTSDALWQPDATATGALFDTAGNARLQDARTFVLDRARMAASLAAGGEISLPMPDGTFERFRVVEDPVLAPELAASYPWLRTYVGRGIDETRATTRIVVSPFGLHALMTTPEGDCYVDPLPSSSGVLHVGYAARDVAPPEAPLLCETETVPATNLRALPSTTVEAPVTAGATLRTYRLAVSTTPAYTAWALANVGSVLVAVAQTVSDVNVVMQRDLGIRLQLIGNTDQLFYDAGTNPYTTMPPTREAVHNQITSVIGSPGFDIGHLFHHSGYGGMTLGCGVCQDAHKGKGRSGDDPPTGHYFNHVVLHEMGHQFCASHTWSTNNESLGEFSPSASWEPGRGTTLMGYGRGWSDDDSIPGTQVEIYYHGGSIQEIVDYTTVGAGSCPTPVATGNTPPVANAGPDFTIPKQTPFRLFGSATDPDDPQANLTYTWEQLDTTPVQVDLSMLDDGVVPLFRSFFPGSSDPSWPGSLQHRYFPQFQVLLDNTLFPATTTPGMLGQQLPRQQRTMHFRLTVRDNRPSTAIVSGGIDQDDVEVAVDDTTGPFRVTSPNGGESWDVDQGHTVTWDVAGSDGGAVNASHVNIVLSIDGGITWPFVLASNTPNDGSEPVALTCAMRTTQARIMVLAVSNLFFDISDAEFGIEDLTPPTVTCALARRVLWPARGALVDVGLTWTVSDNCDPPSSLVTHVSVHSDEPHGLPPYAPDAFLLGVTGYGVRADRSILQNGRVYLFLVEVWDTSNHRAFACCTAVVPRFPTVGHVLGALAEAANAEAECNATNGATLSWAPHALLP